MRDRGAVHLFLQQLSHREDWILKSKLLGAREPCGTQVDELPAFSRAANRLCLPGPSECLEPGRPAEPNLTEFLPSISKRRHPPLPREAQPPLSLDDHVPRISVEVRSKDLAHRREIRARNYENAPGELIGADADSHGPQACDERRGLLVLYGIRKESLQSLLDVRWNAVISGRTHASNRNARRVRNVQDPRQRRRQADGTEADKEDTMSIIAVVGATGRQGGGLVRKIQSDPERRLRARALTRNAGSTAAKELAGLGAEVVQANLDDLASVTQAFRGAAGAYCVTNFWEHGSPAREIEQARVMAVAAAEVGLGHVVWSTLEDTRARVPLSDARMPTLLGSYKVPHFDAKAEADAHFLSTGVPLTRYYASFYWESFISAGAGPKVDPDGSLVLRLPLGDARLPGIAAEDIGATAFPLFLRGRAEHGAQVGVSGAHLTGEEMAAAMARAFGRSVRYEAVDPKAYRGAGFPGAAELGNMFQYYRDFSADVCALRDAAASRLLNPSILDFDAWLARWASKIPLT